MRAVGDTEANVAATDRRAIFVGAEKYTEVGGTILRDLFTEDRGGYFEDVALLDMLVVAKLGREANALMEAEGWKWAQVFLDYPLCRRLHTRHLRTSLDARVCRRAFCLSHRLGPDRRELHWRRRRCDRIRCVFGPVCHAAVANPASHRGADLRRARRLGRLRAGSRRDLRGDPLCNLATDILLHRRGARRRLGADAVGRQQLREKDLLRLVFLVGLTTLLPKDGAKGSRFGFVQLEGQWKNLDAERVAFP
jgi:hypothetical protein